MKMRPIDVFASIVQPRMSMEEGGKELTYLAVEEPAKRQAGVKVADVAELVNKLKNEAKVI